MRHEFWAIFALLSIGVVGGTIYNWPDNSPRPSIVDLATEFDAAQPTPDLTSSMEEQFAQFIRKGDNYLRVGSYKEAIDYFQAAGKIWKENPRVLFRLGVANYFHNRLNAAESYLRESQLRVGKNQSKAYANRLMLAKTWVAMGRTSSAVESLIEIFLNMDGQADVQENLKFETSYELMVSLQNEATQNYSKITNQIEQPAFEICGLNIDNLLGIIDDEAESNPAKRPLLSDAGAELRVIQQPGKDINLTVLSGNLRSLPVKTLLVQISEKVGLNLSIAPDAEPFLTGQVVKLNSDSISVSVLLDSLLYPLDVSWQQIDDSIRLVPFDSLATNKRAEKRANQAIRLGRYLLVKFNQAECRDAIVLSNANLLLLGNDFDSAAAIYSQLLEGQASGELKAKTHYNRGLVAKRFDRSDEAIEEFLAAVDQSLDTTVQAASYLHISQIHIQNNHIKPAIITASRSLSLTSDPTVRGKAAINLARAYLIDRDPASANRFLFDESEAISHSGLERLAGAYSAYARSLATLSPIAQKKSTESLVLALADIDAYQITNPADSLVLAKAYQQIGLPNQAVRMLNVDIPGEKESWARQRTFEYSLIMEKIDVRAAVSGYKELASDASDLLGKRSILRLADYQLNVLKDPQSCINLCSNLWQFDLEELIKTKALDLMGIAYRELGDIDSSIYCFYGMLPEPASTAARDEESL